MLLGTNRGTLADHTEKASATGPALNYVTEMAHSAYSFNMFTHMKLVKKDPLVRFRLFRLYTFQLSVSTINKDSK